MPLQVEQLYSDDYVAAFAVSSLMALLAVGTLIAKSIVEWKVARLLAIEELAEVPVPAAAAASITPKVGLHGDGI